MLRWLHLTPAAATCGLGVAATGAFRDMIAEAAGRPVPVHASVASPALLAAAGMFSPVLREMHETAYQFRAPFVVDSSNSTPPSAASCPRRPAMR